MYVKNPCVTDSHFCGRLNVEAIEMRDIGRNIRDLWERAKLTQDVLAEQLCKTGQTISNYERGKTRPDVEQILRLAGS